jgi:lipid-A-disaccharide synthase-like uncharacterized protein
MNKGTFDINMMTMQTNWEEQLRFLGIKLINANDFFELVLRLLFTVFIIFIIVQFLYARNSKRKDYYFSFFAVGITIFLLSYLLNSVKLEIGFALGLFAIFGIIRYRTDTIPIKEMTYMFVVIGVAVINALSNKKVSYVELIMTNTFIVGGLWILEKRLTLRTEHEMNMLYEKIEYIHSTQKDHLLADLRNRTGIHIHRYRINRIDFLRDVAELTVYYYENGNTSN